MTAVVVRADPRRVTVTQGSGSVIVGGCARVVEIDMPGPQGPAGPPGPAGPAGAGGGNYVHTQAIPSASWLVVHNLGMFPNVAVVDSAETVVIGQVTYLDANTLQIDFAAGFAGFAYVS